MEAVMNFATENVVPISVVVALLFIVGIWFYYKSFVQTSVDPESSENMVVQTNPEQSEEQYEDSGEESPEENSDLKND